MVHVQKLNFDYDPFIQNRAFFPLLNIDDRHNTL